MNKQGPIKSHCLTEHSSPSPGFLRRARVRCGGTLIAAHYLADATTFWRLCDANNAIAPDALAARDQVGIPTKER
jgi:hypothetical protein